MPALSGEQWAALGIFVLSYGLIISNRVHRTIAALLGAVLVAVFVLKPPDLLKFENWETLIFVFGMMTVIATMEHSGFFRWLGLHVARSVRLDPLKLFIFFPLIAAFLSAFVDSITVMLFMTTLTLEVAAIVGISPLPLILAEISAANIGGASTMVGDPPNVILGTYFHYSFMDFVVNTGPAALIGLALNIVLFILVYRRAITAKRRELQGDPGMVVAAMAQMDPKAAIADRRLFRVGIVAFLYVVVMLLTHHTAFMSAFITSLSGGHLHELSVAMVAITGALIAFFLGGPMAKMPHIMEKIDYATILFFAGLFLIVGGLEEVGLLKLFADAVKDGTGGNYNVIISVILWFAAISSSVVDNVPMAATMAPILKLLSASAGIPLPPLVWSAALGTDIGGNGTPIGASANVVAVATYEKATGKTISWAEYCVVSYPIMIAVMLALNVYLLVAFPR